MIGLKIVKPHVEFITEKYIPEWANVSQLIIEECGRVSHKSEHRIKEGSAAPFIKRIGIDKGHENIIENFHYTVCFIGSRSMSHQLVRHRISSPTQESMRYCDYSKEIDDDSLLQVIIPPSIGSLIAGTEVLRDGADREIYTYNLGMVDDLAPSELNVFLKTALVAYEAYIKLTSSGVPPEDARYVLPHGTKTEVYMTMNFRSWRNFFRLRRDKHAQWEIRMLANTVFDYFLKHVPVFFEDMSNSSEGEQDELD